MVKQQWIIRQKKKGWVATTRSGHVVVRAESRAEAIRKTARVAREIVGTAGQRRELMSTARDVPARRPPPAPRPPRPPRPRGA
jgi:hypothetical protein